MSPYLGTTSLFVMWWAEFSPLSGFVSEQKEKVAQVMWTLNLSLLGGKPFPTATAKLTLLRPCFFGCVCVCACVSMSYCVVCDDQQCYNYMLCHKWQQYPLYIFFFLHNNRIVIQSSTVAVPLLCFVNLLFKVHRFLRSLFFRVITVSPNAWTRICFCSQCLHLFRQQIVSAVVVLTT